MMDVPEDFVHAAFFFVDIVGLSNPVLSTNTQRTKIKILNELIYSCDEFTSTKKDGRIILPTGDGMLICFKHGLEEPIKLAIELQSKIVKYNEKVLETEKISTRIGCHIGHVFVVKDIYGNQNLWGPGAILARRVMDLGDENHILLTSTMANNLLELSDEYRKILHPLHDYEIKHGDVLLVYSAFNNSFGNPNNPVKGVTNQNKTIGRIFEQTNKISFDQIDLEINLKDSINNLIKVSKTFQFRNNDSLPVDEMAFEILTDNKKSLPELDLTVKDEHGNSLEIGKIPFITDYQKFFSVKLDNSNLEPKSLTKFTLSYVTHTNNRFFETILPNNSQKLFVNFNHPSNAKEITPNLLVFGYYNREKILQTKFKTQVGVMTQIKWDVITEVKKNDLLRIEW